MQNMDCELIKRENEALIQAHGGEICDWLPSLDQDTPVRDAQAAARRGLVRISLNAPFGRK